MNYKLEVGLTGLDFHQVAKKAKEIATQNGFTVEFKFNGKTCLVDESTDPALLFRDYLNAYKMKWITVGPNCPVEYSKTVKAQLERATKRQEEQKARQQAEYEEECRIEKQKLTEKTGGITLDILDMNAFNEWKSKNTDPYGACIFEYVEGWGKLMQYEMSRGKSLLECAQDTSFELGYLGISGFMYGAAVNVLALHWKYGEELRKWHNGKYDHKGSGVVNPAVLTIS